LNGEEVMGGRGALVSGMILVMLVCVGSARAEDEGWSPFWNLTAGGKGVYASGVSESSTYFLAYGEGSLNLGFLELAVRGSRYWDYQIADGLGSYEYVGVNEGSAKASLKPWDYIGMGGDYKFASGDSSFERREWSGFLRIGPDDLYLEGEYGTGKTDYLFNTAEIEIKRSDASLSLSWDVSDSMSMEIGYDRNSLEFSNLEYQYVKQTGRLGALFEAGESVFILAGVSGGGDSEKYAIAGADVGAVAVVFSRVKISAIYLFEQYIAPSTSTSSSKTGGGGSTGPSNPFLSADKIGESYSSHRLSVGASISLF